MTQDGPPVGLVPGSALPPEQCVEIAQLGATKPIPGGPREVLPRLG